MYGYTWSQWLAFFYLYCFFGWCFESSYVSLHAKHFVNRGFLRGPVLPLYGSGGIMMLMISSVFPGQYVSMFFLGMICATVLEYVTGVVMERIFKVRYWDYSGKKFNFGGYICLESSIAWGVLTVIFTTVINKPVERWITGIRQDVLEILVIFITVIFIFDMISSVRAALSLAKVLEAMTKARAELDNLRVQLALAKADFKDASSNRIGQLKGTMEIRLAELKAMPGTLKRIHKEILRGNPGAVSGKYADAFRELKEQIVTRHRNKF